MPNRTTRPSTAGKAGRLHGRLSGPSLASPTRRRFRCIDRRCAPLFGRFAPGHETAKTQRKYQQNGGIFRRQDFDGDQRDQLAFIAFLTEALRRCARVVRRGGLVAVFSDWRQQGATQTAIRAAGFVLRGCAVWGQRPRGARPIALPAAAIKPNLSTGAAADLPPIEPSRLRAGSSVARCGRLTSST